jgi:hypothetical protein
MVVLLFWNIGKRAGYVPIGRLCREHDVDILLLAEAEEAAGTLAADVNAAGALTRVLWEVLRLGPDTGVHTVSAGIPGARL